MGCFRGAVLGLWSEFWRGCDAAGAGAMTRSKPNGPLSSVDARCTHALRGGRRRRRLVSSPAVGGLVFVEASFPILFGPVGGAANPGVSCSAGSRRCLWQSAPSGSSLQPWSATLSTARFSGSAYRGPDLTMALRVGACRRGRVSASASHSASQGDGPGFPGRRWGGLASGNPALHRPIGCSQTFSLRAASATAAWPDGAPNTIRATPSAGRTLAGKLTSARV